MLGWLFEASLDGGGPVRARNSSPIHWFSTLSLCILRLGQLRAQQKAFSSLRRAAGEKIGSDRVGGMGVDNQLDGRGLARAYYVEVVAPLLASRWPGLPHAAGRLGSGSDVLGLDDQTSRDHDWGLRLNLFVEEGMADDVRLFLDGSLPRAFRDLPTRFAFTGQGQKVHHVDVDTVSDFAITQFGFDPLRGLGVDEWLSLTGQSVLEVIGGPVFSDTAGDIGTVRRVLNWYPDDLWRYLLACDWIRIGEELPLMSRAGNRGDELGSRVIAGRIVDMLVHLAFLIERRWQPYAKWRGTLFATLQCAPRVKPNLLAALTAADWRSRQAALEEALNGLLEAQGDAGIAGPHRAVVPFWDRPYLHPNPGIAASLLGAVTDPSILALPRGAGSVEQRTDNVTLLLDPVARRRLVALRLSPLNRRNPNPRSAG